MNKTHPKRVAFLSLVSHKGVLVGENRSKKPSEFEEIYINSCLFLKIDPDTPTPNWSAEQEPIFAKIFKIEINTSNYTRKHAEFFGTIKF